MSETKRMDGRYGDRAVHPEKKEWKKSLPPRYPFISLITAGPVFGLEGSVPFRSLFPPCGEINKPAANALVRAQCAAICLGGFVYLALINFNNGVQPARDPRWLSGPGAPRTKRPDLHRAAETSSGLFLRRPAAGRKPLRIRAISLARGIYSDVLGGSSTVASFDVGLV